MNRRILLLFALIAITTVLIMQKLYQSSANAPAEIKVDTTEINRTQNAPVSYADMLEAAQKHVVSVYTSDVVRVLRNSYGHSRNEHLRRYYGLPSENARIEERKVASGTGSGVIISENGYIITNDHVIRDKSGNTADEILVRLHNDKEYQAVVIGRDPRSDIAVLKIDASDLSHITIADSDKARVGDVVFAIGNPMGVGMTVTSGIVSATGRNIGIYGENGLESFIQTDASINPGNSGGALVDHQGRLIGINSAILSKTGSNIGSGFAIPSNIAKTISKELIEHGQMKRGAMGVSISPLSKKHAQALGISQGVLIVEVIDGYGAKEAGIKAGDVITKIDNSPILDMKDLTNATRSKPVGSVIEVTIWRDNQHHTTHIQLR